MAGPITTAPSSALGLQALATSTSEVEETTDEISTGLDVSSAEDDAATVAVAEDLLGDLAGLSAVTTSIDTALSVSDVALAAGEEISDLLLDLEELATSAADPSIDEEASAALDAEFSAILAQIDTTASAASFGGISPLVPDGGEISAITSPDASTSIAVPPADFTVGGSSIVVPSDASIATPEDAAATLSAIGTSITNISASLAEIGSAANALTDSLDFAEVLSATIETGVGSLIDSDLAEDSATLAAGQVSTALGIQTLSVANSEPSLILGLFGSAEEGTTSLFGSAADG